MKKSCLVAVIAVLAAVAGALAAVALYLNRREKELDEYERLLFGEDDAETVESRRKLLLRTRPRQNDPEIPETTGKMSTSGRTEQSV